MKNLLFWINFQSNKNQITYPETVNRIIQIGEKLHNKDYLGYDVSINNPIAEISTVLSLSLVGWLNLYKLTNNEEYLENANYCIIKLLKSQNKNGSWLFPYFFRKNPANYSYACENFMTIRPLFFALEFPINHRDLVIESIRKNIDFLLKDIGYKKGIFWYSANDKIEVPNISSMAANVFSKASVLFDQKEYFYLAIDFAEYCIDQQLENGGYSYFSNDKMVYIPYHALEIWELFEANNILNKIEIEKSINFAINYLSQYFLNHGYQSRYPHKKISQSILFKTYIWAAKAFILTNHFEIGFDNFFNGLRKFSLPGDNFFYLIREFDLKLFTISIPFFKTQYIRYHASLFETGTFLLLKWKDNL
jgi:hypothetical protein